MKLDDFVALTISQIVDGVKRANENIKSSGAEVGPRAKGVDNDSHGWVEHGDEFQPVHPVEFDVALTVSESTEANGKAGISIASIVGLSANGSAQQAASSVSRVKFVLPLLLPRGVERTKPRR